MLHSKQAIKLFYIILMARHTLRHVNLPFTNLFDVSGLNLFQNKCFTDISRIYGREYKV